MKDVGLTLKLNMGWIIPDPDWIWIFGIGELFIFMLDCAGLNPIGLVCTGLNPIGLEPPGLTKNLGTAGLF